MPITIGDKSLALQLAPKLKPSFLFAPRTLQIKIESAGGIKQNICVSGEIATTLM